MKKTLAFLLVFMMLMGVLFIGINAEETTFDDADCACGDSYGAWSLITTEICQVRYKRQCDNCGSVQTAKDIAPKTVSYSVPAIAVNRGDTVILSLYDVYFDSSTLVSADEIEWSSDEIAITDGYVCPDEAGVYKLTATAGTRSKSLYVVAKNPEDTEYVLFFDDFSDESLDGYRPIEIPKNTEYYVSDGKLIMDATGNTNNHMRLLLPSWVGDFGDYEITTSFTMLSAMNNTYWFAVMARIQNVDFPYWQAAVRQNATVSNGVEIAQRTKASGASNGWNVTHKASFSEKISASEYYVQDFDLSGANATHSINGQLLITSNKMTQSVGDVGFQVRASKVSIDSIKIVIPIEDSIHSFTDWNVIEEANCKQDGFENRYCVNCGKFEERTVKGGHAIVSHALKMPTCTESGFASYETCSVCDYTTYTGEIIAPLGHYYERILRSVAHRGYSVSAPENTLPAYRLAKEMGFIYVECDVSFTKDGVAVLLHDDTIDRTSNGAGKISELTYEELLKYDFGSWKNTKYAETAIPTFEEFIALCKELGLHPYIELKSSGKYTQSKIQTMVETVEAYGMIDNCTWISFEVNYLKYVRNVDDTARLGYVSSTLTQSVIDKAVGLRNENNEVFLDISYTVLNNNTVMLAALNGFAVETWTVDTEANLKKLPKYVSGITSNVLVAGDYFLTVAVTEPSCNQQGYTTYTCMCGEISIDDYVPATGGHISENGVCLVCGADIYCADPLHNLEIIGISYEYGFGANGIKVVKCLDCNAKETEVEMSALFICKGYSVSLMDVNGVTMGFRANKIAIEEYERATGKTVCYGAFAVSQDKLGDNEIFGADGKIFKDAICVDVTERETNEFSIKLIGFEDNQKDLPFAIGAYVMLKGEEATEYSYIQSDVPKENERYLFVSYNDIINTK